jgi:hypothetical protein
MAKATTKNAPKKSPPARSKAKSSSASIEKTCEDALKKLQTLQIDQQLQADLEWCLGSYKYDKNPAGLYEMAERAITVFKAEQAKKTKGVTAKLVSDLEKVVKNRA